MTLFHGRDASGGHGGNERLLGGSRHSRMPRKPRGAPRVAGNIIGDEICGSALVARMETRLQGMGRLANGLRGTLGALGNQIRARFRRPPSLAMAVTWQAMTELWPWWKSKLEDANDNEGRGITSGRSPQR